LVNMAGAGSNSPLIMLELRHLGGALARLPADLSPMGRRDSKFLMFGAGATPTPEVAQAVQVNLVRLAEEMRPYETGATYVNFLEFGGATPERVRAAYAPEDWERLVELKDRYDPQNLFRFNRNIPPSSARE
jgi:FAD/FMN-containing dehydrogenase